MATQVGDAYVEIGARNQALKRGLAESKGELQGFGATAKRIGGLIFSAFVARAVIRGVRNTTNEWMKAQDALNGLANSIASVGGDVQTLLPRFERFSKSMQKSTKYGDSFIQSMMSQGLRLGVTTDKIEDATTAAIGLSSKLGVDATTAMLLVYRASRGATEMFSRYGVVLDKNMTDQQKFNEILKIGNDAFKLAETEARTMSGTIAQMKNNTGDAKEELGGMFTQLVDLKRMFEETGRAAAGFATALETQRKKGTWIATSETIKFLGKGMGASIKAILTGDLKNLQAEITRLKEEGSADVKKRMEEALNEADAVTRAEEAKQDAVKKTSSIFNDFAQISQKAQESILGKQAGMPMFAAAGIGAMAVKEKESGLFIGPASVTNLIPGAIAAAKEAQRKAAERMPTIAPVLPEEFLRLLRNIDNNTAMWTVFK